MPHDLDAVRCGEKGGAAPFWEHASHSEGKGDWALMLFSSFTASRT